MVSEKLIGKLAPNSFLPRDTAGFYRYVGSLTTPSCNEGVIWTVFTNKIPISKQQVVNFIFALNSISNEFFVVAIFSWFSCKRRNFTQKLQRCKTSKS